MSLITAEKLREILIYDPATGLFRRRASSLGCSTKRELGSRPDSGGYAVVVLLGARYRAHRLAWLYMTGEWPLSVDHINGVRSDNRWSNLREADNKLNTENARRPRSSNVSCGVLGVTRSGSRFIAQIKSNGRHHYLGSFDDATSAHAAYVAAKRVLHVGCTL